MKFPFMVFLLIVFRLNILKLSSEEWYTVLLRLLIAASLPLTILIRSLFFFAPRLYSHYQADAAKLMIRLGRNTREIYYNQTPLLRRARKPPKKRGDNLEKCRRAIWS